MEKTKSIHKFMTFFKQLNLAYISAQSIKRHFKNNYIRFYSFPTLPYMPELESFRKEIVKLYRSVYSIPHKAKRAKGGEDAHVIQEE